MGRHKAWSKIAIRPKLDGSGRHAKRTTVYPTWGKSWGVDYATFDQPTNPAVFSSRLKALDHAHDFERAKARARFIETHRRQPLLDVG